MSVALLLLSWLPLTIARAFDEPQDHAGPLTVRIEGPATIEHVGSAVDVAILIKNDGPSEIHGVATLGVIDDWRAEPTDPVAFGVDSHRSQRLAFRVTAGAGTLNALYPIHAIVRFKADGQQHTAHPILVVQVNRPDPPRAEPRRPWRPVPLAANSQLGLVHLAVHRTVLQVRGQQPVTLPVGWSGSEPRTRASVRLGARVDRGGVRQTVAIHPPWYEGRSGTALVEFPIQLPAVRPLRLHLATAIRDHDAERGEPPSDGVTFRVRAAPFDAPEGTMGQVLLERHSDAKRWQEAEVPLDRFAGQAIRLQLESHPGPRMNTACDQSYWAEPTLIAGTPRPPAPFPPAADSPSELIGTINRSGAAYQVRVWPGRRGLLDAAVGLVSDDKRLLFHGLRCRVMGDDLSSAGSATQLVEVQREPTAGAYRVRHRLRNWAGTFDLLVELGVESGGLRADLWLENVPPPQPWSAVYLEDAWLGAWSERAERIYAGVGNVIERPDAFRLGFDGHRLATSFVGFDFANGMSLVEAVDVPPDQLEVTPAERRCTLHVPHRQRRWLIPAASVWEAVSLWRAINGLRPAAGVPKLAGRFVFDLWGGRYSDSARSLERAMRYGLTDSLVVWHNWQRWGYDYRLPDIFPPNPRWGTHEEFRQLVEVCRRHHVLFAPHDNYIDFYPDADGFSYQHVAMTAEGVPIRAWLNRHRQAQSYRWRPDRVRPFLERNLRQIREDFHPTAYFIDVWSSIRPYDWWTGDGQFHTRLETRRIWGEAFDWIRQYLGDDAPQISESGHDQLVGHLDGAQTNHLRVGPRPEGYYSWAVWPIRCADAERVPWFDAAHHDRFVLHGAGYQSRYAAGLDTRLHGIYSDDYISTEVLTGHPAMVAAPFGRDVVRKYWLLHDLMRALALRQIAAVEFVGGDVHRQHVRWSGGGQVWVNRGPDDWPIQGHVLPQYGFFARVPTEKGVVEAAIERRDGVLVEWSRSPEMLFVNARPPSGRRLPVRVSVESLKLVGKRTLELRLRWVASQPLPVPLTVFAHFVDKENRIQLQGDHAPRPPTDQWRGPVQTQTRIVLPDRISAGQSLELRVGLFHPPSGVRAPLPGIDDGTRRIRLGTLRLLGNQNNLTGIRWLPLKPADDPLLARLNPDRKMIAFDSVSTNGAVRLTRDGAQLQLTPLPESAAFNVRLQWQNLPWPLPAPGRVVALDETGKAGPAQPIVQEGRWITVRCRPGVFAWRLAP